MVPTPEAAERVLAKRLDEKGLAHSRRVAETSAEIARAYGLDVDLARLAGLLHDWDRGAHGEELLRSAKERDLELSASDEVVPYLLHARTGAAGAAEAFADLPAEVVSAIGRHTLGAVDMSGLDMVVYIADTIEPHRHWRGVGELRELVGTVPLETLFARTYEASFAHLVASRKRIHPESVAVWNAYVAGEGR